jgi:hypothetical protein
MIDLDFIYVDVKTGERITKKICLLRRADEFYDPKGYGTSST